MSDKYEKLVDVFKRELVTAFNNKDLEDALQAIDLAAVFRWYDTKREAEYEKRPETLFVRHIEAHLATTQGAIPVCKICGKSILDIASGYEKRAAETCEWWKGTHKIIPAQVIWLTECGKIWQGFEWPGTYRCWCGRRIVEKQSVVAPTDKGVTTRSVQVTPDE